MILRSRLNFLAMVIFSIAVAGCQTPRPKEFESVQVGMDKNAVLDAAGNPDVTRRWKGLDRWIYVFDEAPTKEVHFREGAVIYVGAEVKPAVSAAQQDDANATANALEAQRLEAEASAARAASAQISNPSSTSEEERRKIAPSWVPVQ